MRRRVACAVALEECMCRAWQCDAGAVMQGVGLAPRAARPPASAPRPHCPPLGPPQPLHRPRAAAEVSPSTLYAAACVLEGVPFINGSPQNTFVPGLIDLAVEHNVLIGEQQG